MSYKIYEDDKLIAEIQNVTRVNSISQFAEGADNQQMRRDILLVQTSSGLDMWQSTVSFYLTRTCDEVIDILNIAYRKMGLTVECYSILRMESPVYRNIVQRGVPKAPRKT